MGIEPTQPAWKAGILAVELHPRLNNDYNNTRFSNSQVLLHYFFGFYKFKYAVVILSEQKKEMIITQ